MKSKLNLVKGNRIGSWEGADVIFTTQKDGFSFLQYMYEDCNIKLARKFEKYKTIKQIINSNDYPEKE